MNYLLLLYNAPLELNASSIDLVKPILPLAYGLVVTQRDVTVKKEKLSKTSTPYFVDILELCKNK